ncbi:hypothetical protein PNF35_31010 [Bacillus cereus]|uniref:hypothetical protein n=1 Tax=Bacillus cereus TaxID=1396 RepID=UPI0021D65E2A|nr:hypothetical protein [Bacillus cereus]MCU7757199.1 hypothetical protein [Bacillus cereus]MDC7753028.1 hypothetical protein [Bacillus cereus]
MTNKPRALVLIDYENLFMGAGDEGFELTHDGFEYFISYLNDIYDIQDEMSRVVCRYRDYDSYFQNFVESLSLVAVNAIDKGKDVADGYLIVDGILKLNEMHENIDEVVIVGGDNVYTGLVRTIINKFKKNVKIIAWEATIASSLDEINRNKVTIQNVEAIFEIGSGKEIQGNWLISNRCSELEFAAISFIANSKFLNGYHLNSLANHLVDSKDPRVGALVNYHETRAWLLSQSGEQKIFIQSRDFNKERTKKGIVLKLNRTHSKVQYVLAKIPQKEVTSN